MLENKIPQLWFKTTKFEIVEGEDSATNPLCYGRQLAEWLRDKLSEKDYKVEDVIPEDWGWCVKCSCETFKLYVKCVNVHNHKTTKPSDPVLKGSDVVWTCCVVAEQSFFSRLFKPVDTSTAVLKLFNNIHKALIEDAQVVFVEQP
jgi:hypothetical protein